MSEPLSQSDQIDALWDYDHPAKSEADFRRALETNHSRRACGGW